MEEKAGDFLDIYVALSVNNIHAWHNCFMRGDNVNAHRGTLHCYNYLSHNPKAESDPAYSIFEEECGREVNWFNYS